jgi:hypothetical protein
MLSDSTILKHIAGSGSRSGSAGFKQLVRELGLRGDGRGELTRLCRNWYPQGQLIQADFRPLRAACGSADKNLVGGTAHHASRRVSVCDSGREVAEPGDEGAAGGRYFYRAASDWQCHARGPVLVDISNVRPDGRAEGRIVRPVMRGASDGGGNFSLRQPRGICEGRSTARLRRRL